MKNLYRNLQKEIRPYYGWFVIVIFLTFISVGLEALSPWPFKFLIDNVLDDQSTTYVSFFHSRLAFGMLVVFSFFLINILMHFVDYLHSVTLKNIIRKIIFIFSKTAFANIELQHMGFYRTQEIGDYIYRLNNDVYAIGEFIEEGILPIFTSSLYIVVTTMILFSIDMKLTLLSLIALPFLAGGLYVFNKRIVLVSRRSEHWNSAVFSFVQQALTQLKVIQAFSQEKKEAREFNAKMNSTLGVNYRLEKLNLLLSLIVGIIIAVSYSFIIGYGITAVLDGTITTGLLVVFIFYLDDLTTPILSIIFAVSTIKENWVKIQHMNVFFNTSSQVIDQGTIKEITESSVEFKGVTVETKEKNKILDNVSFSCNEGDFTVVLGVSGSGKTSLVSLIPRLVDEPTKGEIYIGKKRITDYEVQTLRRHVAIVPQESHLFNATIREVIAFGNPDCTEEDIIRAAKHAHAHEFIERLPGGYHFKVGEGGNFLSGGQRQRLAIARAFVKKADIYIFDEPFASLDVHTREMMWESIRKVCKGKTTIMITNILDVVSSADKVIVLDRGKIMGMGKYSDLQDTSGVYNIMLHAN